MADVGMREKDPVRKAAERLHLVAEVRSRVDEEPFPGGRIEEAERGDADAPRGIPTRLRAERLMTAGVRNAPVLRDSENDGLGPRRGRGQGEPGQEESEHPLLL